ncbi:MAG: hypothetical protein LBL13_05510, partial [Bacteroidales bacterium]|nr:hypothetical protein [Bacteroidales bacterium]
LPAKIRKGGDSIEYVYSAKGEKLAKKKNGAVVNYYCGNMVYKADLTPEYVIHPEGLALYSGGAYGFQFNLTDHLGNVRTVLNASAAVQQANDYFPFGLTHATVANIAKNKYLYNGKELQNDVLGSIVFDQLDYGALFYDPVIVRWHVVDPLAEQNRRWSPYAYCYNNPLRFVDPDGRETRVAMNDDGTYRVIGGELNKDRNIYVYTQDKDGNYTVKGNSIGITTSTTSFYNSDANDGKGAWAVGSIINPNDQSGDNFLGDIFGNNPAMFDDYIANAGNGEKYDFKTTNGTDASIAGIDEYRGMPIGVTDNGQAIYSSARDIGNMAAGYVAGTNGMSWTVSRIAFDAFQSKVSGRPSIEGISTRNAEYYGWRIGSNIVNNTPTQKANNLSRSIWNWITK